jgi:hypothetical protein
MNQTIRIRDPRIESGVARRQGPYPTLDTIAGKTMVVLNNEWTCMNEIAGYLGNALKSRYGVARVLNFPVPVGVAADAAVIDEAARAGDFAVVGLAN